MNFLWDWLLAEARSLRCLGAGLLALLIACQPCLGQSVRLTEDAVDPSAGNLACYKIETPTATYFLEKEGAGLSSMLDVEGVDWIGFHPEKGSAARGEYRGFPNAVHREDGSFFHPRNAGTGPSTCRVVRVDPDQVVIVATSGNDAWSCLWKFHATHCSYTMTKKPPGKIYWVLYEGTPGGACDDGDWWMTSAIQGKKPLGIPHDGDIPAPEWIVFGDTRLSRVLFLFHTEDDEYDDRFYLMHESMTVFGFGRQKLKKYLDTVPQIFALGFIESTHHMDIANRIESISGRNP